MRKLPGLIDAHVHCRTPGQTEKEDFYTATSAALAGGFTTILDMPNNAMPVTTEKLLEEKMDIAAKQIVCDVGFHFGSLGDNLEEFEKVRNNVFGLKLYLNKTTGNYTVDEKTFEKICNAWQKSLPILVHAEEDILEKILLIAHETNTQMHICHISSGQELQIVLNAKQKGWHVTCGVTPHHLFLTEKDLNTLGNIGKVKPSLKPQSDVNFLWQHLKDIDMIESDHAPHTLKEKQSENPPFGFPGLETTLPLLLTAVHKKKLTIQDIIRLCHDNPAKIFHIDHSPSPSTGEGGGEDEKVRNITQPQSYIEIDENEEWIIKNENLKTKCGWSPFNGWKVTGKIKRVFLRNTKVFEDGKILENLGSGKILKPIV
jgi:carbamoyl-phosphate synthase / aspartate carbamoyltransferase / dihydroorotase